MDRAAVIQALDSQREALRARGVTSLRLFGSVARDEASPDSDVDILVDFARTPTFDEFMDLRFLLEDLLGAKVDLVTENGLREEVRPRVKSQAIRVA